MALGHSLAYISEARRRRICQGLRGSAGELMTVAEIAIAHFFLCAARPNLQSSAATPWLATPQSSSAVRPGERAYSRAYKKEKLVAHEIHRMPLVGEDASDDEERGGIVALRL